MPGFSYQQIEDLFRRGGRVLGRAWGARYDEHLGQHDGSDGRLMPDCSDYCIEAGHTPLCPPPCAEPKPARIRIIG